MSWETGNLAAKQLYDALYAANINPAKCGFVNLFGEHPDAPETPELPCLHTLRAANRAGAIIVAMGKKVAGHLASAGVPHTPIVHPAARGAIRGKNRYIDHVKEALL